MPELPEVETMRRGILCIEGEIIDTIRAERCRKRPLSIEPSLATIRRRISGRKIQKVDRWGKRLILVIENGLRLVFEPRMTGLVLFADPPTTEHLRFSIRFKSGMDDLLFWDQRGLGTLTLYDESQFKTRFGGGRLGPDALKVSTTELRGGLATRKIPIKVGLLDQKAVAGIGNIYASEILFLSGVDPRTPCDRITKPKWNVIFKQMNIVLRRAIKYEGSSLNDGTFRNALNEAGNYQNHHQVYDREDQECLDCRSARIVRVVQAQRSTYYCPKCQATDSN